MMRSFFLSLFRLCLSLLTDGKNAWRCTYESICRFTHWHPRVEILRALRLQLHGPCVRKAAALQPTHPHPPNIFLCPSPPYPTTHLHLPSVRVWGGCSSLSLPFLSLFTRFYTSTTAQSCNPHTHTHTYVHNACDTDPHTPCTHLII